MKIISLHHDHITSAESDDEPAELPARWGLLYEAKGRITDVVGPKGNLWPPYGYTRIPDNEFMTFQHRNCEEQERNALYSIARRLEAVHPGRSASAT